MAKCPETRFRQCVKSSMRPHEAECSAAAEGAESEHAPVCPAWPPAERLPHECEWPLFGSPHLDVHDSEDETKSRLFDQHKEHSSDCYEG